VHVVFLTSRYWPAIGGAEILLHYLAPALAEHHEVTVLAHRIGDGASDRLAESLRHPPPFAPFDDGGAHVIPVEIPRMTRVRLLPLGLQVLPISRRYAFGRGRILLAGWSGQVVGRLLAQHLRTADLLHVWGADLLAANGLGAARRAGVPLVITPFMHVDQWGTDPASIRTYRQADRMLALLDVEGDALKQLGVAEERIAVCGSCSPGVPTGGGAELRRRLGIDGPLVVFLGVRRSYKGHDLLLDAARELEASRPDVFFAFVGPGDPLEPDRLGHRIIDGGQVDEAGRGAWLEAADLLCLPSAHEIFPLSVLEAFSARTPVLLSDLPPLRELVSRSGGGRVVQRTGPALAAALRDMLADPIALRRMGDMGHAFWSTAFTPEAVARCHERVYQRVATEGKGESARSLRDEDLGGPP
jgi:glycosyltransferase involved in cell wall biosynthesis